MFELHKCVIWFYSSRAAVMLIVGVPDPRRGPREGVHDEIGSRALDIYKTPLNENLKYDSIAAPMTKGNTPTERIEGTSTVT